MSAEDDYNFDASSVIVLDGPESAGNYYDFMDAPENEKEIVDIDQIGAFIAFYSQSLVNSSNKKQLLEANNKQFFAMIACFAYDSVSTSKGTTNNQELFLLSYSAFTDTYTNLHMREDYQILLLNKLPGKTWPSSFVTYIENLQDLVPSEKWIGTNAPKFKTAAPQILKNLLFGFKVIALAKDAFKEIKLHYNRYV